MLRSLKERQNTIKIHVTVGFICLLEKVYLVYFLFPYYRCKLLFQQIFKNTYPCFLNTRLAIKLQLTETYFLKLLLSLKHSEIFVVSTNHYC